jgi:predicted negative regulator of RcsB-dependent stress response
MKRTERRHLKDNELAMLASSARHVVEERKTQIVALVVALALVGGAGLGYYLWRDHVQAAAHGLLADALVVDEAPVGAAPNPDAPEKGPRFETARAKSQAALTKFKVVADTYPATDAGIFARYREAATWMALASPAQAATSYQQVIDRAGESVYGQMARLGLAEAQAETGQFDQAIATFKQLSEKKDGPLPVDGILMQLGRTYLEAGKPTDARQAFDRLTQEFPDSPFSAEARQALDNLKKS